MNLEILSKETLINIIEDQNKLKSTDDSSYRGCIKYMPWIESPDTRILIAKYLNNKVAFRDNYHLALVQADELIRILS